MQKTTTNTDALHEIFENLQQRKKYGEYCAIYSAFFSTCLYRDWKGKYIYWRNYGSSAHKNTIECLAWILEHIFHMMPEQFTKTFSVFDEADMEKWKSIAGAQNTNDYRTWRPA